MFSAERSKKSVICLLRLVNPCDPQSLLFPLVDTTGRNTNLPPQTPENNLPTMIISKDPQSRLSPIRAAPSRAGMLASSRAFFLEFIQINVSINTDLASFTAWQEWHELYCGDRLSAGFWDQLK